MDQSITFFCVILRLMRVHLTRIGVYVNAITKLASYQYIIAVRCLESTVA